MPVISTLTITGQLNALGLAFWLVFFLFGRVTSTLLICKGALIQECTGSAFPSHAKLAFTPSQGQALWVFSQSLCSQRLTTEQPRKSPGSQWQRGTWDQPSSSSSGDFPEPGRTGRTGCSHPAGTSLHPAPGSPLPTQHFSAPMCSVLLPQGWCGVPTFWAGLEHPSALRDEPA